MSPSDELTSAEVKRKADEINRYFEPPYNAFVPLSAEILDGLRKRKLDPPDAVSTPFPSWNKMCRDRGGGKGLAFGWYVIIGGGANTGKTQTSLNMAVNAMRQGETVTMISLEMAMSEVTTRLSSIASSTDIMKLEYGDTFDYDVAELADEQLSELPGGFILNDIPIRRLQDITAVMEFFHKMDGSRVFIVDFLQLVATGKPSEIYDRVTEISEALRDTAKKLNVLMIALSQLKRVATSERKVPPQIYDLLGGSSLENAADQVLLLNHANYQRDYEQRTATTEFILGKNRFGPVGTFPIVWDYKFLQCREPYEHETWSTER
jgi:replicative DNA helicase